MNPGAWVAIHAATTAAAAEKAKTRVLDCFRSHDATAPDRAQSLVELGLADDDNAVRELLSVGVVRGVDSRGRLTVLGDSIDRVAAYYLDEVAFIAHREAKNRPSSRGTVVAAFIVTALLVLGAALVVVMAVNR